MVLDFLVSTNVRNGPSPGNFKKSPYTSTNKGKVTVALLSKAWDDTYNFTLVIMTTNKKNLKNRNSNFVLCIRPFCEQILVVLFQL